MKKILKKYGSGREEIYTYEELIKIQKKNEILIFALFVFGIAAALTFVFGGLMTSFMGVFIFIAALILIKNYLPLSSFVATYIEVDLHTNEIKEAYDYGK